MIYDTYRGPYGPWGYPPPFYSAAQEEKRRIRRTSNRLCWTVILCFVLIFLLGRAGYLFLATSGYVSSSLYRSFGGLPPLIYYLLNCSVYALGISLPAFLYFAVGRIPLEEGLPFRKTKAMDTAALVLFGCMICLVANYPAEWVSRLIESLGYNGTIPDTPLSNDPAVLACYGIETVLVPPLVEEMMFRGVVLQSLRRFGDGFAILGSALIFGMMHGNFPQTAFAFLAGLAMGYAAVQSGSLLPSILIHFINNLAAFLYVLVGRLSGEAAAGNLSSILSALLLALGLLSAGYLVLRGRFLLQPEESGETALPLAGKMGALFSNPGAVVFSLLFLISAISFLNGAAAE